MPSLTRWLPALALLLWCGAVAALDFPPLNGQRVVDEMNLLDAATRTQLTERLARHERLTSNQVVVVILKSLRNLPIEEYGYQLGREWGIGQKGQNNGALLIVAPNERKLRIEVGYGLEGTLTDAQTHLIIQNVMGPRLREGKFDQAVLDGTDAIITTLTTTEGKRQQAQAKGEMESALPIGLGAFFFGMVFLSGIRPRFLGSLLTGGVATGLVWLLVGALTTAIAAGIIVLLLHLFMGVASVARPGSHYGGGGFGGGGFGGGGFGGFGGSSGGGFSGGGGSFGGGGASGSW